MHSTGVLISFFALEWRLSYIKVIPSCCHPLWVCVRNMPPAASAFSHWLTKVPLPGKYGLCASLLILAWLSFHAGRDLLAWALKLQQTVSWRRVILSRVPRTLRSLDLPSYPHCFVLAALLASNLIVLLFLTQSWAEIQRRAGALAIIYLLPLLVGPSFSQTSSLFHIDRDTLAWIHRWVGRICVIHCLLHGTTVGTIVQQNTALTGDILAACVVPTPK